MKKLTMMSSFALIGLIILCQPFAAPKAVSAPAPTGKVTPEKAKSTAWEAEWKQILERAKKEGKVNIYCTSSSETRAAFSKALWQKYGIELEFFTARAEEITNRLASERRANLYLADLYIGGSTICATVFKPMGYLDPIKSFLVLPEVTDPKVWYGGGLYFVDKERQYIACPILTASNNYLSVNTSLVKPGEIKSYRDLLNPKWKGKIIINDPTIVGAGSRWFAVVADRFMGLDYMRELVKQEPVLTRDQRLQVESLARGKYSIAIGGQPDIQAQFIKIGAPIQTIIPDEGAWLGGGPGLIAYFNRAPHPNATRVFVNWFLSKEGQTLYSKTAKAESARLDVPTDHLDKGDLRERGVKYFISEDEEFLIKKVEYDNKWAKEVFGPLMN